AIRTVFDAAIERAHGTRTASGALTETMRLLDFGGDTADAARAAAQHTTVVLDTHADACHAVGRAAERAADEVAAIKTRLRAIRSSAGDHRLVINDATGVALPPSDFATFSPGEQQRMLDAAVRLTDDIKALLVAAELADEDLAAALRGADGDLSADGVETQLAHCPPQLPTPPPLGSDPQRVSSWWHALTPAQQDRAEEYFGEALRNLDGVPTAIRSELNIAALHSELTRLQQGWYDGRGTWHTHTDKLADLRALQDALTAHPDSSLILLDTGQDPRKVLAAIAIGDVDNAERVGVTVGGLSTRVSSSVGGMVGEAQTQRDKASDLRRYAGTKNFDAVAAIAWLGYDAPDSVRDVTHDWSARDAATPLANFYRGLAAATNVSDQHIAAFGHSYGSLLTSLALQRGAPVSDVVLYGSPGTELANAAQLGVEPGHAYYMVGVNDDVAELIPYFGAFGAAPQDVPGMTELSTATGVVAGGSHGDGQLHQRAYGHSEYARMGSNGQLRMSGYNLAAVLAGLPDDLITAPRR
ncbi:alpha/beta hydrolase, partial [Mycobacterium sp. 1423905.2]|uniref:alpha/beta hydrolase n=1 Tax=Mycobacterium sp. 1423905.2 TaxID=1856859 RepID=UPI000B31A380